MVRPSSLFLVFFLHVVLVSSCTTSTEVRSEHSRNHVAFFIFGDSFFDAGNNNYINTTTLDQANFWPYGETYFKFPTGRFADGRLISDFIAEYAKLPLIPPFLQPGNNQYYYGVNFASVGAGALVETFQGAVRAFHITEKLRTMLYMLSLSIAFANYDDDLHHILV
ncbi:hypothetical protein CMV_021341 [Castanea mollissima]|uniref:Uncharacterized protein n=1 Tax=Castanea mollissima TaxID=60419 RepID=A0A8J4QYB5_9ROSI|nr:hypothetical protein CMV_021341 [Castanea mollissima]